MQLNPSLDQWPIFYRGSTDQLVFMTQQDADISASALRILGDMTEALEKATVDDPNAVAQLRQLRSRLHAEHLDRVSKIKMSGDKFAKDRERLLAKAKEISITRKDKGETHG